MENKTKLKTKSTKKVDNRVEVKEVPKQQPKPLSFKKASIKPFIEGHRENMGLEDYDLVVFPNVEHSETLAALESNGVVRYLTGLDEFAPEIRKIKSADEKAAKILEIRTVVAHLERELASNDIDVDDEDFWKKVQVMRQDNHEFFGKIEVRCGNKEVFLDPENSAEDLIKIYAIKSGGFTIVGKSFADAKNTPISPKFYLDSNDERVTSRTTAKKSVNKAISLLEKIYTTNPEKLIYMAKVLDGQTSLTFSKSTHIDVIYDLLDDYISGKGVDKNSIRTSQEFTDTSELSFDTLKIKALITDATFYSLIALKPDGMLYHQSTGSMVGKNVTEVLMYLSNPLHEDVKDALISEIASFWDK